MALSALLQFTQGATVGGQGIALVVTSGNVVVISNSDNSSVQSYRLELCYAPPGSVHNITPGVTPPIVLAEGNGVPSYSFLPENGVYGCYRFRLTTWSGGSFTGNSDVDIRCIATRFPNDLICPPLQKFPDPLPLPGSGLAGAKPGELNFGGQPYGWQGDEDPSRPLLWQALKAIGSGGGGGSVSVTNPVVGDGTAGSPLGLALADSTLQITGSGLSVGQILDANVSGSAGIQAYKLAPLGFDPTPFPAFVLHANQSGVYWSPTVPYDMAPGGEGTVFMVSGGVANWEPQGAITHGNLSGLDSDDHVQYLLVDGTRGMSGSLNMNNNSITNVPTPIDSTDVANKAYVDLMAQGIQAWLDVDYLSDWRVGTLSGEKTIDGFLTSNSRVNLTYEVNPVNNGIWVTGPDAWVRPADFANGANVAAHYVFVKSGTNYKDTGWICTSPVGQDQVGTWALTWSQFSAAGIILAGNGLYKYGNTIAVSLADGTLYADMYGMKVGTIYPINIWVGQEHSVLACDGYSNTWNSTPNLEGLSLVSGSYGTGALSVQDWITVSTGMHSVAVSGAGVDITIIADTDATDTMPSGSMYLRTGDVFSSAHTGSMYLRTGSSSGTGTTGGFGLQTGGTGGSSGGFQLYTGGMGGSGTTSGGFELWTGSGGGNSGGFSFVTGGCAGASGSILFQTGSATTVGTITLQVGNSIVNTLSTAESRFMAPITFFNYTNDVVNLGAWTTASLGALYLGTAAPVGTAAAGNYSLKGSGTITTLNAATGGSINLAINDTAFLTLTGAFTQYQALTATSTSALGFALLTYNNLDPNAGILASQLDGGGTANRVLLGAAHGAASWGTVPVASFDTTGALNYVLTAQGPGTAPVWAAGGAPIGTVNSVYASNGTTNSWTSAPTIQTLNIVSGGHGIQSTAVSGSGVDINIVTNSDSTYAMPTGNLILETGFSNGGLTGNVYLESGNSNGGNTGSITILTGSASGGSHSSGSITVQTSSGSGNSGGVTLQTGNFGTGSGGGLNFYTGSRSGTPAAGTTGGFYFSSGGASGTDSSGGFTVSTGTCSGSGTPGPVTFQIGGTTTAVWTKGYINFYAGAASASSGNTIISALSGTPSQAALYMNNIAVGSVSTTNYTLSANNTITYLNAPTNGQTTLCVGGISVAGASQGGGVSTFFHNTYINMSYGSGGSSVVPTATPSSGNGYAYIDSTGAFKYRSSSGTITTMGLADPHCSRCQRDFAHEWENTKTREKLSVCMPCLMDALEAVGVSPEDYSIENTLKKAA